jgi:hypothetical protein
MTVAEVFLFVFEFESGTPLVYGYTLDFRFNQSTSID